MAWLEPSSATSTPWSGPWRSAWRRGPSASTICSTSIGRCSARRARSGTPASSARSRTGSGAEGSVPRTPRSCPPRGSRPGCAGRPRPIRQPHRPAGCGPGGDSPCPVRDHPSVRGRQRASGPMSGPRRAPPPWTRQSSCHRSASSWPSTPASTSPVSSTSARVVPTIGSGLRRCDDDGARGRQRLRAHIDGLLGGPDRSSGFSPPRLGGPQDRPRAPRSTGRECRHRRPAIRRHPDSRRGLNAYKRPASSCRPGSVAARPRVDQRRTLPGPRCFEHDSVNRSTTDRQRTQAPSPTSSPRR